MNAADRGRVTPQLSLPFSLRQLKGQLKALQKEHPAGQLSAGSLLWEKFGAARQAAKKIIGPTPAPPLRPLDPEPPAPLAIPRSTVTKETYEAGVRRIQEYILAGDAFQVVYSQRFHLRKSSMTKSAKSNWFKPGRMARTTDC